MPYRNAANCAGLDGTETFPENQAFQCPLVRRPDGDDLRLLRILKRIVHTESSQWSFAKDPSHREDQIAMLSEGDVMPWWRYDLVIEPRSKGQLQDIDCLSHHIVADEVAITEQFDHCDAFR